MADFSQRPTAFRPVAHEVRNLTDGWTDLAIHRLEESSLKDAYRNVAKIFVHLCRYPKDQFYRSLLAKFFRETWCWL